MNLLGMLQTEFFGLHEFFMKANLVQEPMFHLVATL
jgi:hypothetical protein